MLQELVALRHIIETRFAAANPQFGELNRQFAETNHQLGKIHSTLHVKQSLGIQFLKLC